MPEIQGWGVKLAQNNVVHQNKCFCSTSSLHSTSSPRPQLHITSPTVHARGETDGSHLSSHSVAPALRALASKYHKHNQNLNRDGE